MVTAAQRTSERQWEVVFRITNDLTIRGLNQTFRKIDKPTDVLAFAQQEGPGGNLVPDVLGDVVISIETAMVQAQRGIREEILTLAAHGLCHLLGYDHQTDEQEVTMNRRMTRLLQEARRRGPIQAA